MKKVLLIIAAIAGTLTASAQLNPAANPYVNGINADPATIAVNGTSTVEFIFGNNGADPIPPNGANWTLNFPASITINQASLNLTGVPPGTFTATWMVEPGLGTVLILNVANQMASMSFVTGTLTVTGETASGPLLMTINAAPEPLIAQDALPGDNIAFSPITVTAPLPVKLMSFTGSLSGKQMAKLNWQVSNPDKFSHFELERSIKGADYTKVATVKLTDAREYQHEDNLAGITGKVLYRLRMIDLDGISALSHIVMLQTDGTASSQSLSLYPNPVSSNRVFIQGLSGDAQYTIHNLEGRQVLSGTLTAGKPEIAVGTLPSGTYFMKIAEAGRVQNLKLVRQ